MSQIDQTYQPEHGRPSTYTNWKCRCDDCRAAWTAYNRERTEARAARLIQPANK